MNNFRTMKFVSVQALLRTTTLAVLGAGALLVTPAQAGIIYSTDFSSIVTSGAPMLSGISTELIASGNFWAEGNYTLPSGWSQVSGDTLAFQYTVNGGGDGSGTPGDTSTGINTAVLLNSVCWIDLGFACTGNNVGSIQYAMTGLSIGTSYTVTVDYWGTIGSGFSSGANNLGLNIGVTGIGSTNSHATIADAITANTGFVTGVYTFIANDTTGTLVLTDLTNTPNAPPAAIVGDVTIATTPIPEPASALFLLGPAAAFFAYRRRAAKK